MDKSDKRDLERQVITTAREYGINTVLYRHAVGNLLGVNVTDMECLGVLLFKRISSPTELAKYTGLSSGATTAMLDRLEKSGLIERLPNPDDRRGTLISIVDNTVKTVGPMFTAVTKAQDEMMVAYSSEELQIILDFLQKITNVWEEERKTLDKLL
jgi:DNA-binding MarR family transcriptional regulator